MTVTSLVVISDDDGCTQYSLGLVFQTVLIVAVMVIITAAIGDFFMNIW